MSPPKAVPAKPADALNPPGLLATVSKLWPYLWPHGRRDLQRRVFLAFGLLIVAKGVTMVTPFAFKWTTDALVAVSGSAGAATQAATSGDWLWRAPILLTILYGVSRVLMALLTQIRDGLFAKVAMHAVRKLALQTFEHMHRLSLRFHLERKTGGLTRVLERGREGIEELSRLVVLTLLPTISSSRSCWESSRGSSTGPIRRSCSAWWWSTWPTRIRPPNGACRSGAG